jgi:hypothetical protein
MLIVPLQALPNQTLQVQLANQPVVLNVYQFSCGLFIDVLLGPILVIGGVICQNRNRIVRSEYLGFVGDFIFLDTQGNDDPVYTGAGTRFVLIYLEEADLAAAGS